MKTLLFAAIAAVCGVAGVPAASGGGGPSLGVLQGGEGVIDGNIRYVALPSVGGGTVVEAIERNGGSVVNYALIHGAFGVPMVTYDGTAAGVSKDGGTLVLGDTGNGPVLKKISSFAVIEARRLKLRYVIRLRGHFSFDALSPGARMLYLTEHVSAQNPSRYRVRAYDLGARRLLSRVVIDKGEWETVMQGNPFARTSDAAGRWVFTLYGGGEHPFVHALDTQHVNAVCIDLPKRWNRLDITNLRLWIRPDANLVVRHRSGGNALAVIDTAKMRLAKVVRNF